MTFQLARFWLNAAAPPNIKPMLLTDAMFQVAMSWWNAAAE
jgi:hypothetical protein